MKKLELSLAVAFLLVAGVVQTAFAADFPIGSKLEDFSLNDPNGKSHKISELKGENGVLIVFLSAQCPVVEMYNGRINALAAEFKEKGINFVGLYSNATECLNWVKHHSGKEYRFKTLIDEGNVIADRFGAEFTPEIFYFNSGGILDYHGAIDNDRSGKNIDKEFLKTALGEKLAGKEISLKDTKAFGCSIKRVGE